MEPKRYSIKLRADRRLGLLALLILILLSILGYRCSLDDNESLFLSLLGEKQCLELNSNGIYGVYEDENVQESAYVFTGEGMGYGEPLEVAVLVDTSVLIQKLIIITYNETSSYVSKVLGEAFPRQMIYRCGAREDSQGEIASFPIATLSLPAIYPWFPESRTRQLGAG
jgi:hypothetical protein